MNYRLAKLTLMLLVLITVFFPGCSGSVSRGSLPPPTPIPTQGSQGNTNDLNRLSSADTARLREIVTNVLGKSDYLTPTIHAEFWQLLDKIGRLSGDQLEEIRTIYSGVAVTYNRYFYQDALRTLKEGRAYKSPEREAYEKKLLSSGVITKSRIDDNQALMDKIAAGQSIPYEGTAIVLDEAMINRILSNLDAVGERVNKLFTR